MSPSGAEVIRQIRSSVEEVDPSDVKATLSQRQRHRPAGRPRERGVGRRSPPGRQARPARVPGVARRGRRRLRPLPARDHLLRLGPALRAGGEHAEGAARLRGRRVDERRHHAVEGPRLRRRGPGVADARSSAIATRATCWCRRSGSRARPSCSTPRCCCSAPAGSARRPRCTWRPRAWGRWASSTTTRSTSPTCSARSSTPPTGSARRRWTPRRSRSTASTRT